MPVKIEAKRPTIQTPSLRSRNAGARMTLVHAQKPGETGQVPTSARFMVQLAVKSPFLTGLKRFQQGSGGSKTGSGARGRKKQEGCHHGALPARPTGGPAPPPPPHPPTLEMPRAIPQGATYLLSLLRLSVGCWY